MFFKCEVVSTHHNCIFIPVLTTLRMATWVAETCQYAWYAGQEGVPSWPPYQAITHTDWSYQMIY